MKTKKKVSYVLQKPIRRKGGVGDVINVTKGFGRYLERFSVAQRVTKEVLENLEESKKIWQAKESENEKAAIALVEKIKNIKLVMKKRVAQGDGLYEAVRDEHVVSAFKDRGIELKNNNIKINSQIKKLGCHTFVVHIYGEHEVELELEVLSDTRE